MKQVVAKGFLYVTDFKHPVTFKSTKGNVFQIRFVSEKVVRVIFSPANSSNACLVASEPPIKLNVDHDEQHKIVYIRTPSLDIKVDYSDGLSLSWIEANSLRIFAQDIKNRAYVLDGSGVYHYMSRKTNEVYCGLGERTGNLNLHGRRFRLEGFDSMGYDAERTDPLYKHCPFYLTLSKDTRIAYGLFYNNMSRTVVDLGAEIDAVGLTITNKRCRPVSS
jgi:alpha-glucosidase (family GH31 glycosyl hydrolase)